MTALRMNRQQAVDLPRSQGATRRCLGWARGLWPRARTGLAVLVTGLGLLVQPLLAQELQLKPSLELTQTSPPTAVPLPPLAQQAGVPMGTGDQIGINVFGQPDLTTQVTLDAVGMITLPLIGPVKALGLLPRQLERLVATRLVDGGYLKDADVVVSVQQTRSRFFSVLGEVARPGRYPLENRLSLLDALAEAGGATDKAEPVLHLIRDGDNPPATNEPGSREPPPLLRFSLDPRTGPDPSLATLPLLNRDVLFVPAKQVFYVYGEVRSPGVFSVEPNLSVQKALSLAGGLTDRGSDRRVVVTRTTDDGHTQETSTDLHEPIRPGDVIRVKERLF